MEQKGPTRRSGRARAAAGFVLLGFVVVVALGYTGSTSAIRSTMDGRTLAGAPVPTAGSVQDGSWMTSVEGWMDDRVLGRTYWLSLHAALSEKVLNVVELNGVTADPDTGMQYEKPPPMPSNPDLGPLAASLGDSIRAAGSQALFVYIPRKEEVFADRLPAAWGNSYLADRAQVMGQLREGGPLLDLTAVMSDPATRLGSYYLTDHHWTPQGALRALTAIDDAAAGMGVRLGPLPPLVDKQYGDYFGSLARRVTAAGTPAADTMVIPTPSAWRGRLCRASGCIPPVFPKLANSGDLYANKYDAFLGGDVGYQEFVNKDPAARGTVMVLKDSFGLPLVTYLAQQAKRVIAVDERAYDGPDIVSLVKSEHPDLVVVAHNQVTLLRDKTFDPRLWVDVAGTVAARARG